MRHDARPDDDLLSVIDELLRQPALTAITIDEVLGVKLAEHQSSFNSYYRFFEATARLGPAAGGRVTVSYREPVAGRAGPRVLTVDLGEATAVTIDEMVHRYGEPAISQIMPDAAPEGLVSYSFSTGSRIRLNVSRSNSASTVRSVTLASG